MSAKAAVQDNKPVVRKDISKFSWTINEMKKNKVAYLMIAPFFILFFIFTVVPVLLSVYISFTTFNMLELPKFVGMDNNCRKEYAYFRINHRSVIISVVALFCVVHQRAASEDQSVRYTRILRSVNRR